VPLLFIGSGLILILTGVKGNPGALWQLVQGDFEGQNNFVYWTIAILVLGSLGYIAQLRSLSRMFVALVLIVLLLDNKGFFAQLQAFIDSSKQAGQTQ
jgi:hypothetical protein